MFIGLPQGSVAVDRLDIALRLPVAGELNLHRR
jgi:hypothetical protein